MKFPFQMFLFLICIVTTFSSLFAYNSAFLEDARRNGPILLAGGSMYAVLDQEGNFDCPYFSKTMPKLNNPTQIALGNLNACAIEDAGVRCWLPGSEIEVPTLIHPRQVEVGSLRIWALDDRGVVSWTWAKGGPDLIVYKDMPHATKLFSGSDHVCATDGLNLKCWGENNFGQTDVPELSHPTQAALGDKHTCAIDDSGVKCWGNNERGQTDVPLLSHPTQIAAGRNYSCALDDYGVKCWGENDGTQFPLGLIEPVQVVAGGSRILVLDAEGVKVNGSTEDFKGKYVVNSNTRTPSFKLSNLEYSLEKTAERMYSSKAGFISGLARLAKQFSGNTLDQRSYRNNLARLILFEMAEPLLEGAQSEYVQGTLLPKYQKAVVVNYKAMGIDTLADIDLNASVLSVLLDSTALALASTRNTTTNVSLKQEIEKMSAEVGMLKAEFKTKYKFVQGEKLAEILKQNASLNSQLMQEAESQPFALVLTKIQNYLENQK